MATESTQRRPDLSAIKVRIQTMGRFLSNMVMPNISAFVAWGLITALFIPTGWIPNERMAELVAPMITYLLPLLIGLTGGRLVGGDRGAVVGAISTMGVIVGASIPMFLGAMIIGPLGGLAISRFDRAVEGRIRAGFEMLVNNFSAGIIGMIIATVAYLVIGPLVALLSTLLGNGVAFLINTGWIPLASAIVEPAKILFLNNTINHGVFTPIGTQEAMASGQSLVFLIEANPGPGLGLLLAYFLFGNGTARQSAPAAMIIHFFGGIQEIYFPYVLMKPRLIIAMIAGGMTNVFVLMIFDAGLRAPASPGSIFAVLLMTPLGAFIGVILSVVASCAVTFMVASVLLRLENPQEGDAGESESLAAAQAQMKSMKAQAKGRATNGESIATPQTAEELGSVNHIVVACDAGMGSSAMGANMLRKRLAQAGLSVHASNSAVNSIPDDADIVITQTSLTERARRKKPDAMHVSLDNFLDAATYDRVVKMVKDAGVAAAKDVTVTAVDDQAQSHSAGSSTSVFRLQESNIFLGLEAGSREEAIRFAGQRMLEAGCIREPYIEAMLAREKVVSTYLGQSLAMPHGTHEARDQVIETGIVVCQYPQGVVFDDAGDNVAHLVIGLAAKGDEHMTTISALANMLENPRVVEHLSHTDNPRDVLRILELASSAPDQQAVPPAAGGDRYE